MPAATLDEAEAPVQAGQRSGCAVDIEARRDSRPAQTSSCSVPISAAADAALPATRPAG